METKIRNYIKPFLKENKINKRDFKSLFGSFDEEMMEIVLIFIDKNNIEIIEQHGSPNEVFYNENKKIKTSNEQLCIMHQRGDKLALDALIQKNEGLVYSRVIKFQYNYNHDLLEDDLFQEGCLGLIKGIEKFDNSLGYKLTTYAIHWIDQAIMRAIADKGFTIRVPVHMFEKVNQVNSIYRDIEYQELTKKEELEAINSKMEMTQETLDKIKFISQNILSPTSLNVNVGEDMATELMQLVEFTEGIDVFEEVASTMLKKDLEEMLAGLTPRERDVLILRFGLNDNHEHTLEEVGVNYEVTRERIRQIEAKSIRRLRHPSRSKYLRGYLFEV